MRRAWVSALACAALVVTLGGCGHPELWARWRAERASWHAQRLAAPVVRGDPGVGPARAARARAALEAMLLEFPPEEWAARAAHDTLSREVARLAGGAMVTLARLEAARGDTAAGLGRLESAEVLHAIPPVRADGDAARARLLEAGGRAAEAAEVWTALADLGPLDASAPGALLRPALAAPLRAAGLLRLLGRGREADAVLERTDARWMRCVPETRAGEPRTALLQALSEIRRDRRDLEGARAALCLALGEPMSGAARHATLLEVAAVALEAGRADTSRAYAAWAARASTGDERARALQALALAWEVSGPADSALEAWGGLLAEYGRAQDFAAEARFHRGTVLEAADRWVQARSEYRALIATQPAHPRAFEASLRIVKHHLADGENDLAELEARHAREQMELLIATQHDETVQRAARQTRAALDSLLGEDGAGSAPRPPAPGN